MSGIGFLSDLERRVDPAEFAVGFAKGDINDKESVVAGFKALIDSKLLFVLDDKFKLAADVLVRKGLIDPPMGMDALLGAN